MSPNRNMRLIFAQCRKFSQSRRNVSSSGSSKGSKVARFLIQGTGGTLGLTSAYILYGGKLDEREEQRQQVLREVFGNHAKVEDLREKMWPEFRKIRKMTWFSNLEKMWSEAK
ncbi:PREDICTED: uncharacterized protein LOC104765924 [Camelina sativa]|uniref:Uncharacterized protein LOC104765924 n=1 Tax=Camelina sativa TaxID=90675 RepID=A0ABM0XMC3_CAMSA|nr:PREDICTED: uncharacterized protein LOC104765924 [Camelina sativa]